MKDVERMVISAYEDGEVGAPWAQQVEQRIASDSAWAEEAQSHRRVKSALAADPDPDFAGAQARVAARLAEKTSGRPASRSLPLLWTSVAAAALLMVFAGAGFWLGRQSVPTSGAGAVAELQVQVPKQLELKLTGEGQLLMASTLERTDR
jgi:anti-sigma factor RsiW